MSYMTTSERQLSLSVEISAARTRAEFAEILAKVARAFGFRYITLMHAPSPEILLLKALLIETSLPAAYFSRADRAAVAHSPLIPAGMQDSALPRVWNLTEPAPAYPFPPELRDLLDAFDMQTGVAIPTYALNGERLLLWLGGDRAPLGQTELNELVMVTLQVLDAYNLVKRAKAAEHPALSAREHEVVRWTAQGKTSIEIGQILSLSDHTVNAYMTSAIRKLDCVNRTQLVAKAIRLKLIN
ncbi:LuxR family transcriptional regulator [Rhizobium sp. Root1220]|uniref:helix-turn-helix transcriptional regulator n=1 Tax=Rhizobium sp. Root1220 TaxID=1736432 RepID=UPI0006FFC1AE|nr:LuxR family transcriptional regulator [Rhizobium sp. Root1220]KQV64651.1 LuxR family transcriptional regulator [Rhizobium sp. Root1220]